MLYLEIVCKYCIKLGRELALESYSMLKRIKNISSKKKFIFQKIVFAPPPPPPLCITGSRNILASGNISLKLFMAPLETTELLIFWYVVAEHHIAQL